MPSKFPFVVVPKKQQSSTLCVLSGKNFAYKVSSSTFNGLLKTSLNQTIAAQASGKEMCFLYLTSEISLDKRISKIKKLNTNRYSRTCYPKNLCR